MEKFVVYTLDELCKSSRVKRGKEEKKRTAKRKSKELRQERKEQKAAYGEALD